MYKRQVQFGSYVIQFTEVRRGADLRPGAAHPDLHGLHTGHLHGPVPQRGRGGIAVQSGAYVGVRAPHREHVPQAGRGGQDEQPEPEGGGDPCPDEHPDVVQGPFGELPGELPAPAHDGPVGAHGRDVVQEQSGEAQKQQRDDAGGNAARRPEAAFASALAVECGRLSVGVRRRGPVGSGSGLRRVEDRQALCGALGLGRFGRMVVLGFAHRVLPCAAPGPATRCSRSTWTTTSGTSIPARAPTRSTTW